MKPKVKIRDIFALSILCVATFMEYVAVNIGGEFTANTVIDTHNSKKHV